MPVPQIVEDRNHANAENSAYATFLLLRVLTTHSVDSVMADAYSQWLNNRLIPDRSRAQSYLDSDARFYARLSVKLPHLTHSAFGTLVKHLVRFHNLPPF